MMLELYKNIKSARKALGMTQDELAKKTGYGDRSSIAKIEKGLVDLPQSKIELFAVALRTTARELMGTQGTTDDVYKYSNVSPIEIQKIPMLGSIACGEPIFMSEEWEVYINQGRRIDCDYCLTCKGDSMEPGIKDGSLVFIKKDVEIINGDVYAVAIDDEATLKRVYIDQQAGLVQLVADNPKYRPMVYSANDFENLRILGKAISVLSQVA